MTCFSSIGVMNALAVTDKLQVTYPVSGNYLNQVATAGVSTDIRNLLLSS